MNTQARAAETSSPASLAWYYLRHCVLPMLPSSPIYFPACTTSLSLKMTVTLLPSISLDLSVVPSSSSVKRYRRRYKAGDAALFYKSDHNGELPLYSSAAITSFSMHNSLLPLVLTACSPGVDFACISLVYKLLSD